MLSRETDADCYSHARLDYHATVRELPSDERPRERLQHFGPQALSQAELLAIILRTGTRGDNALELANKLLSKYGGLPGLVRADFQELCAEHGMGEAKSAQVKATLELGRRLALVQMDTRYKIATPQEAANLVMMDMAYLDTEHFGVQMPVPISTFNTGDFDAPSVTRLRGAMGDGCHWLLSFAMLVLSCLAPPS